MKIRKHLREVDKSRRNWRKKYEAIRTLLEEHRREFWVGEDTRNTNLLLICRGGWAVHMPMDKAKSLGILQLVGNFDDPILRPKH